MTPTPPKAADILVVDDTVANLRLLTEILRDGGYKPRLSRNGRLALEAARAVSPDLILLDINMPEMNGFEVCKRLKADENLAAIPVLFLSALDREMDKVEALRSGGVDYVTKPFQLEEVQARVETHLALHHARQIERDLLEKTLNGAVKALSGLTLMTSPALAERSEALRSMVVYMAAKMPLKYPWQYELAAMLCLIGCIALPPDTFERAYRGENVSAEEIQMYRAHPDVGFQLLSQIPRLEVVAEMIRLQQTDTADSAKDDISRWGALILKTAQELDRRTLRGTPFQAACVQLQATPGKYSSGMLAALKGYSPAPIHFEVKSLASQQLLPGMMLEDDVVTRDRSLTVISKGTILTAMLIERVRNFAKTRGVCEPIQVRMRKSPCPDESQRLVGV